MVTRILVTGATGAIGVPLVHELVHSGAEVTILANRNRNTKIGIKRLYELFNDLPLTILFGDIEEELCGIDEMLCSQLSTRFDVMVHAVGKTQYHEHLRGDTMYTNVNGTKHAVSLAETLEVPRFVFVSTCYTAGSALFFNEDERGDVANAHNPYEYSKILAEEEARAFSGTTLIARLSTVIGDGQTGKIINVGGYAGFVKGFWARASLLQKFTKHPFWAAVNPSSTLNLVTADWTAYHLACAACSHLAGTIHLAHTEPVNMQRLFDLTFGTDGMDLPVTYDRETMLSTALPDNNRWRGLQAYIDGIVRYFGPYVTRDTVFGHTQVCNIPGYRPPDPITDRVLKVQLAYMQHHLFPKRKQSPVAAE